MSVDFYAQLPAQTDFVAVLNDAVYTAVPDDWLIVLTDIEGSTAAINAGKYKTVNLMGASSIIAVLNAVGEVAVPFVFGGDGATLLVPPSLREPVRAALLATQQMARESFDLTLRVGMVPVSAVTAAGKAIRVAKFCPSEHYEQAMFSGGGLAYAEKLLKDSEAAALAPRLDEEIEADFTGLECRWEDIPSPHEEVVSLLVLAQTGSVVGDNAVYRGVTTALQRIYGDAMRYRPIHKGVLRTSLSVRELLGETRVRVAQGFWARLKYVTAVWLANFFFRFVLIPFDMESANGPWRRYLELVEETADYRKYDDILRLIIAGTAVQREQLEAYLAEQQQAGKLVYGLHVADRALLTCLVFERMGRQVHFVDGADGGYALAAQALKRRLGVVRSP